MNFQAQAAQNCRKTDKNSEETRFYAFLRIIIRQKFFRFRKENRQMVEKLKNRRGVRAAKNSFAKVSVLVAVVSISQGKGLRAAAHKPQ